MGRNLEKFTCPNILFRNNFDNIQTNDLKSRPEETITKWTTILPPLLSFTIKKKFKMSNKNYIESFKILYKIMIKDNDAPFKCFNQN
jgi:hypothetical protein